MADRQMLSTDDLKDRLLSQLDLLVHHFAPPAPGSYHRGPKFFTLNPGRADRSVGSFCITMSGPNAGRWRDYATGEQGDVIDLIGLHLGLTEPAAKFRAAREWLGLDTEDPATRRAREELAARKRAERERQAAADADRADKMRKAAVGLWLSGQERILDTPVDHYLRGRGIDLRQLPHIPGAIRFHPECRYYHEVEEVDETTGEVTRRRLWRPMPAMVCAIARGRQIIDCHRTYLARDDQGRWTKAPVPDAKKVFGDYTGGAIRLSGEAGPRGGHLRLAKAPQGSRVFVAEGIENALSLMMLRHLAGQPPAFVVAAGMLHNLGRVELPAAITSVVLAADSDQGAQAQEGLQKAVAAHARAGRTVAVWRSQVPGEDLNDALKRALAEQAAAAETEGAV